MTYEEYEAKVNEAAAEFREVLGKDIYLREFLKHYRQHRTFVANIDFLISDGFGVTVDEICKSNDLCGIIKTRLIADLKKKIVSIEEAILKLEAHNA
jgi:hypothetical protein